MDRAEVLLNDLRTKLQRDHGYRLGRALNANISFVPVDKGEFEVVVQPHHPPGTPAFKKKFTKIMVFAGTFHLSPYAWSIEKRACDYARDILEEALRARGV